MVTSSCIRCGRQMAHCRRRGAVPAGYVQHQGHGLCRTCHNAAFRRPGTLQNATKARTDPDWAVVCRVIGGERLTTSCTERRLIVAELSRRGASARAIADRLGSSERTVERYRAQIRSAA